MMKKVKKLMAVMLSVLLVMSVAYAPVSATETESGDQPLTITSVESNKAWYDSGDKTSLNIAVGTPVFDNNYGTWVQWDAGSSSGVTLNISLADISRVSKVELYVGKATWSNTNRPNSQYTAVPVTALGSSETDSWGVETSKALNGTGTLSSAVIAETAMASTNTATDLQRIEIDVDSVCDSLSLVLSAAGGAFNTEGEWVAANNTTRMAVAEIVVYGEELDDVLRDDNGVAVCTVESSKPANATYMEEKMLDSDVNDSRWRSAGVAVGGTPVELIFRLDGVYELSAFGAYEYWQKAVQSVSQGGSGSAFKNVDLYVGNTIGAITDWGEPIAKGLSFADEGTAGKGVENRICGSSEAIYTADSFKMVINGADYTIVEGSGIGYYYFLTDVKLYGKRIGDLTSGTTMQYCEMASADTSAEKEYDYIAKTADLINITPTFNGVAPDTVIVAAYNAEGKLVGVSLGEPSDSAIPVQVKTKNTSHIKIFGWGGTDSLIPVSTSFTRYAVTAQD